MDVGRELKKMESEGAEKGAQRPGGILHYMSMKLIWWIIVVGHIKKQ